MQIVPAMVARSMGADLVIAVPVTAPGYAAGAPRNLVESLFHGFDMATQRLSESELAWADVVVRPDFGTARHARASILGFIRAGEDAARVAMPLIRERMAQLLNGQVGRAPAAVHGGFEVAGAARLPRARAPTYFRPLEQPAHSHPRKRPRTAALSRARCAFRPRSTDAMHTAPSRDPKPHDPRTSTPSPRPRRDAGPAAGRPAEAGAPATAGTPTTAGAPAAESGPTAETAGSGARNTKDRSADRQGDPGVDRQAGPDAGRRASPDADRRGDRADAGLGGRWARLKTRVCGQALAWATKGVTAGIVDLRLTGVENIHRSIREGRPVVFAGWHGHNFLTMCSYHAGLRPLFKGTTIMVPESANGRVLDYMGSRTDFTVIKVDPELGPSQWARATISVIKRVRDGNSALLSPDGPDGPAYRAKPGVALIGRQARAVVIPASAAVHRGFKLRRRWDEHLVPLPFSRAVVHFGTPIDTHPPDGPRPSVEDVQARVETALNEGIRTAQRYADDPAFAEEGQ